MEHVEIRGVPVPRIGFGTWQLTGTECYDAVRHALDLGYRHIDTARAYGNEHEVGRAMADSGVDREEVFLTTKLWRDELEPSMVEAHTVESIERLGTEYVDLLLIHWPTDDMDLPATLRAMQQQVERHRVRFVGVSNFDPGLLLKSLDTTAVFCDQVEYHPFTERSDLLATAQETGVLVTAYSPLAKGRVFTDPTLREVGRRYGKSAGQVALRWLVQQPNVCTIPRSSSAEHRAANIDVFDFELDDEAMASIASLGGDRSTSRTGRR